MFERVRESHRRREQKAPAGDDRPGVRGERHTRRASSFVPPVLSPKLPFPVGRCDGEYTVYSSGTNWWNLHMSHGPCNHRMKGDCARVSGPVRRSPEAERSGAARRGRRGAPRPARGGGGAGRDITRSTFSRGSASASQVTLKNTSNFSQSTTSGGKA